MRTSSAWIYKQHSDALGRTFKVQDTNHRLMTGIAYRGSAMCYALNYAEIVYKEVPSCCNSFLPYGQLPPPPVVITVYDGGQYNSSNPSILDGGQYNTSNTTILSGGVL